MRYILEINKIYHMDCLDGMRLIDDKSIDMILCDLPYGTTQNKWDTVIPLDKLWEQYERIIKDNGAIVLTAQTPFDKVLGCSNLKLLRYEWIWHKNKPTGFLNANKAPMKYHENILVFYKKLPVYNPQKTTGHEPRHFRTKHTSDGSNYGKTKLGISGGGQTDRYPKSVLNIPIHNNNSPTKFHPTQKPVELFEYFIRTYTQEGDLVLDNCMGSGTTAIAAMNAGRNFVGFELDENYYRIANERIQKGA